MFGLKTISERLGHQDPAFTARVYQSVLPKQHEEAAAAIGALIREARKGA